MAAATPIVRTFTKSASRGASALSSSRAASGSPQQLIALTSQPQRKNHLCGSPSVVHNRSSRRTALLVCANAVSGPKGKKRDYSASASDKIILRLPPGHQLRPSDVKTVFDYPRDLSSIYTVGEKIGAGSFGVVFKAIHKDTGVEYACKSISKIPKNQSHTTPHHLLKVRSEVDCMLTLGASLDAVFLKDVFEDDQSVHLVMELCTGGPLIQSMDTSGLSEKRVAELIRGILRFLAQCHSKDLIYRDVKPGNFLFSNTDPSSSLKATDFGLMIQHSDDEPNLTTRAGTPVYIAPEVVLRNYGKEADVYSVGVLTFQLLTGRFPYWPSNKFKAPTMNQLFDIIAGAKIDFKPLTKEGVSEEAQDFLQKLLAKDPDLRITAAKALEHPWIKEGGAATDTPMDGSVVQRLQRFAVNGHLKQYVLNLIAEDLMSDSSAESTAFFEPLRDMFQTVDADSSGDVSVEELIDGLMQQGYTLTPAEVEQLVTRMDVNRDGQIDFDEFATCLLDWQEFQDTDRWKSLVERAFNKLDLNGDGYISLEEIITLLPESFQTKEAKKAAAMSMMREFDASTDGLISWSEFYDMLSDMSSQNALEYYDRRYTPS